MLGDFTESHVPRSIEEIFWDASPPHEYNKRVSDTLLDVEQFLSNELLSLSPCTVIPTERKGAYLFGKFFDTMVASGHLIIPLKEYQSSQLFATREGTGDPRPVREAVLLVDLIKSGGEVRRILRLKIPNVSRITKVCAYLAEKNTLGVLETDFPETSFRVRHCLYMQSLNQKWKDVVYLSHTALKYFDELDHASRGVRVGPQIKVAKLEKYAKEAAQHLPISGNLNLGEDELSSPMDAFTLEWIDPILDLVKLGIPQADQFLHMERVQIRMRITPVDEKTAVKIMVFTSPSLEMKKAREDKEFIKYIFRKEIPPSAFSTSCNRFPELVEKRISGSLLSIFVDEFGKILGSGRYECAVI